MAAKKKTPPDGVATLPSPRELATGNPPPAKPKHKPLHPIAAHNLTNRPRGRKR